MIRRIISAWLFVLASTTFLSAQGQNDLLQILAQTKHEFTIYNKSAVDLEVRVVGLQEVLKIPKSTGQKVSTTTKIKSSGLVKARYLKHDFEADTNRLAQQIRSQLPFPDMWSEIQGYITGLNWTATLGVFQQYALRQNIIDNYAEIKRLEAMYKASSGVEQNEWSPQFQEFSIKPIIKIKQGVAPYGAFLVSFPVRRQDLNEYWGKKSSRGPHEFILNGRLFTDKRLGKESMTFFNAYWFIARERISYGLRNEDNRSFFVGSDYVSTDASGFVPLASTDKINLTQKRWSAGGFLRWSFFPKTYFDLGAGYYALQNIEIEFDNRAPDEGNAIQHLSSPNELRDNKFKKVATLDNPYFGLIRIGIIPAKKKTKGSVLSVMGGYDIALSCKISPGRSITTNDNFHLYTQEAGQFVTVPLSAGEEEKIDLQFNLSIGFTF